MKLTVKEGKANKIHIYVDEEYRATVDSDYWYSEKYRNYKEINDEELTELLDAVSFRRAYNKGLDLLSRRPYGVKELTKKLCEKGYAQNENTIVTSLIARESVQKDSSEHFVRNTFEGSLPKFLVAFLGGKTLSEEESEELKRLIDEHKEK